MKTGTGLALICVGAILAFAVTANNSVFNWNIAGWVIMLVGLFGLVIPRRGYAWVSRKLTVRQAHARPGNRSNDEVIYPSNVGRNPANSRVPAALPAPGAVGGPDAATHVDAARDVSTNPADMRPGETQVVEDVYEE
jgi:hypothetical protein